MHIIVRDINCPLCGSEQTRSKVQDEEGWWYICDNWSDPHEVEINGKVVNLKDNQQSHPKAIRMFYFNPDNGKIEIPGFGIVVPE